MVFYYEQPPAIEISLPSQHQDARINFQQSEYNINLIRCLFDEDLGKGNVSILDLLFAPNVLLHGPDSLEEIKGIFSFIGTDFSS